MILSLLLGLVTLTGRSVQAQSCSWQVFYPPNLGTAFNVISAATALGPADVWAAGSYVNASGFESRQFMHFDGKRWRQIAAPDDEYTIGSMSAFSDTDIWAVGDSSNRGANPKPLILHWDGTRWVAVANPAQGSQGALYSSIPMKNGEVWASGFVESETSFKPIIEHFDGRAWQLDSIYVPPNQAFLYAIAGTTPQSLWAAGTGNPNGGAFIEQRLRSRDWAQYPTTLGNTIGTMSARSPNQVWAAGPSFNLGSPFAYEWDGEEWENVPYPRGGGNLLVTKVDATSKTGYTYFAGAYDDNQVQTAFGDRYRNGKWEDTHVVQAGSWQTMPTVLASVQGSADIWLLGNYSNVPAEAFNLAERWTCPRGAE